MNFNDYSAMPAREQYAAARWFLRDKRGGFVCQPNGIPQPIWIAARAVHAARREPRRDALEWMHLRKMRASARARGFTHVQTMAGWLPIAEWTPYGNGIEATVRFQWINGYQARDGDAPKPGDFFLAGVWTFWSE